MPRGDTYYTSLRLDPLVADAVKRYAKRNQRSFNSSVNLLLRAALITPPDSEPSQPSTGVQGEIHYCEREGSP